MNGADRLTEKNGTRVQTPDDRDADQESRTAGLPSETAGCLRRTSMTGDEIIHEIEKLFPDAQCELHHQTPFQLLVAVVLSAQTTDAAVNKVTPSLFAAYPDAASMAAAQPADLEPYIQSIGLYRTKAKNIAALARQLEDLYNGQVPSTHRELEALPGVGRKTANVVRSVAFDIPSFAVDTHVDRISKRLGLAKPQDSVEKVEQKLKRKISRDLWNRAHHEMIFFGRYFCTARNPQCEMCPFTAFCRKEKLEAWKKTQKKTRKQPANTKS